MNANKGIGIGDNRKDVCSKSLEYKAEKNSQTKPKFSREPGPKAASHASLAISSEKGSSSKSASHEFGASYRQRKVERTRSLPLNYNSISGHLLPSGWQYVAKRSEGIKEKASSSQKVVVPVTNAKFAEEEELISAAQAILRNRLANLESNPPAHSTSLSKKQARRKIRQNLYMLSLGSEGDQLSTSSTSDAHGGTECFSLASEVKVILKAKLFGLDRSPPRRSLQQSTSSSDTYLHEWFHHFDPQFEACRRASPPFNDGVIYINFTDSFRRPNPPAARSQLLFIAKIKERNNL
ncbi:hypothetical protein YC2023_039840 [Brassica napus]